MYFGFIERTLKTPPPKVIDGFTDEVPIRLHSIIIQWNQALHGAIVLRGWKWKYRNYVAYQHKLKISVYTVYGL